MSNQAKVESVKSLNEKRGEVAVKSSNLVASRTASLLSKSNESMKRGKLKFLKRFANGSRTSSKTSKEIQSDCNVPKNTAVHFGRFYSVRNHRKSRSRERDTKETETSSKTPRSEFTRQMVYKLERSVGTKDYARQVSALLEETAEPPNFGLNLSPAENTVPEGRQNPSGYPLWYKEPHKMPFAASEEYELIKGKYARIPESGDGTESITESSDFSRNEESQGSNDVRPENSAREAKLKSTESASSNWSTSPGTVKDSEWSEREDSQNWSDGVSNCEEEKEF